MNNGIYLERVNLSSPEVRNQNPLDFFKAFHDYEEVSSTCYILLKQELGEHAVF